MQEESLDAADAAAVMLSLKHSARVNSVKQEMQVGDGFWCLNDRFFINLVDCFRLLPHLQVKIIPTALRIAVITRTRRSRATKISEYFEFS